MSRTRLFQALLVVLALVICTGTLSAAVPIAATPTAITLHCDQGTGPTAANVGIYLVAAGNAINVTVTSASAAVVLPNPAVLSVSSNSSSTPTNFSLTMAAACAGATNGQTVNLTFTPPSASGTALTVVATLAVTAPTIVASANTIGLICDTVLGPAPPVNVGIYLASAGAGFNVTASTTAALTAPTGPVVIPALHSVTTAVAASAVPFAFSLAPGCKNFIPGTTPSSIKITFMPAAGTGGITITANLTVTNSASALLPSPSSVTISCQKSGTTYNNLVSATVNVTSAANGGTPFTIGSSLAGYPSWLSVSAGGTATTTAVALTVQPVAGCGGLPVGVTTYQVHLLSPPAPDKLITVNIQIGVSSTLVPNPTSVSLSFQTGTTTYTPQHTTIALTTPAVFFSVDNNTVPVWLSVSPLTATTSSAQQVVFTPTGGAATLALGGYTANVHLKVSGQLDCVIPVYLQVVNGSSSLQAAEGQTLNVNWTLGNAPPTFMITPVSTDSPISYSVAGSSGIGDLNPQLSAMSGVAYSFGSSPIQVTFPQSVFAGVTLSTPSLTGIVTFTYNTSTTYAVTLTVYVKPPVATITALVPSTIPTAITGTVTVGIVGTGFITGSASIATNANVTINGIIVPDLNVVATVNNSTSIVLAITVPAAGADPYLPMNVPGPIVIGVCNPGGTTCSTPTSTLTLTVGINPIVQAVTPASSFAQVTPPALPSVSPFDILAVFGTNFCVSSGTGCTGGAYLYGTLDPVTMRYLTTISPDAGVRNLSVAFQTHAASPAPIANAPLLFASNGQINVIAPEALKTFIGSAVDMVVTFGSLQSAPYTVAVVSADPGVFTLTGDGQGDAAAEDAKYALIGSGNAAVSRSTLADSDIISMYLTGLGNPDSDGTGAAGTYSLNCMIPADYWANLNGATGVSLTSNDGLVIQSAYFDASPATEPCIKSTSPDVPTVTIGNVNAPVKYAGWVTGAIAGLYQINVQMPASGGSFTDVNAVTGPLTGTASHLPVVVTANGNSSLASGVALYAVRGLKVAYTGTASGTRLSAWAAGGTVVVTDASANYTNYTITSTGLPAGLSISATDGTISGTPSVAAVSADVTFNVTDTTLNISGSVTAHFTIAGH